MLSPNTRDVAFNLLRPPVGYRLDTALLTTFTLNLEALLPLPLAVLSHADGGVEDLLANPLGIQQALRDARDRIQVFVDARGIAVPGRSRKLFGLLESSVHPVAAPNGGVFHPKVWLSRFTPERGGGEDRDADRDEQPLLRVLVLSRNLTFDRSWDVVLATEAHPRSRRRVAASVPLGEFIRALPTLTVAAEPPSPRLQEQLEVLASEAERTAFPAPDGFFEDPVTFHALGLSRRPRRWRPRKDGYRTLAVAPFVNRSTLDAIRRSDSGHDVLVSRQEALDELDDDMLASVWNKVLVLSGSAQDEPNAEQVPASIPSGLHAKLVAVEHARRVTWYVGSANLTVAAFDGRNVEMMAELTGRRSRHGIDRFLNGTDADDGFERLCREYVPGERVQEDIEAGQARKRLEAALDAILEMNLRIICSPTEKADAWTWRLAPKNPSVRTPDHEDTRFQDVEVSIWPISLPETSARRFVLPLQWPGTLSISELTAFVAFRLSVPVECVDDIRVTLKLPVAGLPDERVHQILSSLIDSPDAFRRYLRTLLGGLDGRVGVWTRAAAERSDDGSREERLDEEAPLLDDLLRAASREPARLTPARRLVHDFRKTEKGCLIVPDDLFAVWTAVEEAVGEESGS